MESNKTKKIGIGPEGLINSIEDNSNESLDLIKETEPVFPSNDLNEKLAKQELDSK